MTIFYDDNRNYSPIIESWVRKFKENGTVPIGTKIVFDGYGENDDGTVCIQHESYLVFVHEDSLRLKEFPEHETTPWGPIHRPQEEVCIYVWYDTCTNQISVIPFEDNYGTELKPTKIYKIIFELNQRQPT